MTSLRTYLAALAASMARTEGQVAQAESVARVKALVGYEEPKPVLVDPLSHDLEEFAP